MREQGEGAITAVCTTLKLPMFSPAEIVFLSEYVKIMCPVARQLMFFKERPMCRWVGSFPLLLFSRLNYNTFDSPPSAVCRS
ncbi:unnamed protein product [Knipowitschia caucasica]